MEIIGIIMNSKQKLSGLLKPTEKSLKEFINKDGRHMCIMEKRMRSYAQLITETLIGSELHPDLCVHHLNGHPSDDSYANLAIANRKIHAINNLRPINCQGLKRATLPLAKYAGLEKYLVPTEFGYRLNCDFEMIPEWKLMMLTEANRYVCADCGLCKNMNS